MNLLRPPGYVEGMDNDHFLATQTPQTPLEIEAFFRLEALILERCEGPQIAEPMAEELEGEVNDLKEELEEVRKELDAAYADLTSAENRIEALETAGIERLEAYDNLRQLC